jgi:hypothetical protein
MWFGIIKPEALKSKSMQQPLSCEEKILSIYSLDIFPAFSENRKYTTILKRACHWSLFRNINPVHIPFNIHFNIVT